MADHHGAEEEAATIDPSSDVNDELDQLEEDVKLMAQKITEFRHNLPDELHKALTSILLAQRPLNFNLSDPNQDSLALVEDDLTHGEKIQMIKQKILNNKSAMSSQLKRMKDCMSRIDKLDSFNRGIIHPAFKKTTRLL